MSGEERLTPDEKRVRMRRPNYNEMREIKDPCIRESDLTMKCLDDNGYDRDKCSKFFMNYKSCRKFWARVQSDRKKKGIKPHLPLPNERDEVKKEYQHIITEKPM